MPPEVPPATSCRHVVRTTHAEGRSLLMKRKLSVVAMILLANVAGHPITTAAKASPRCAAAVRWRRLLLVQAGSAVVDRAFPDADGPVAVTVGDGRGGWFVGGEFSCIGQTARTGVAHLGADGVLDLKWVPKLPRNPRSPNPYDVLALARSGSTLYVGGGFGVAALDARGATRWLTPVNGGVVEALVAGSGRLYVAGAFTKVGSARKPSLAALDPRSGRLLPWRSPAFDASPLRMPRVPLTGLALDRSRLFVAGDLAHADGKPRSSIAELDAATGRVSSWAPPDALGSIGAIMVTRGLVFTWGVSGFTVLSERTGEATPLSARTSAYRFAHYGNIVYLAGNCQSSFQSVQGRRRHNLAAITIPSGRVTNWNPNISDKYICIETLSAARDGVLMGGTFSNTLS